MTLDRLHELLQRMFGWYGICPHSFQTIYGEFFGLMGPTSRTAARTGEPRDESGVALAQAAGEEGLGITYLYGYRDEWQVQIRVEKILSAAVGVAYHAVPEDGERTSRAKDVGEYRNSTQSGCRPHWTITSIPRN